ncbi:MULTISPECIES: ABC transporter permease [Luteibacter]|uniref:ABC transporter permease n=1 Tax=Luteibacter TaxID=242605 RepID=UPI00055E647E|nr:MULTISPECIES: FtsX-like permease family protein [unclassified Luteibacter]
MTIHPMISALRRHKAGVILIVLQISLTLAIVCNSVFIIGSRIERIGRPTGLAESDLFLVTQQWVGGGAADGPDALQRLDTMQREDLSTLRSVPEVASATPINSLPLLNSAAWNGGVALTPDQRKPNAQASFYFVDESVVPTLGIRLIAGRTFNAGEIDHKALGDTNTPSAIIVSNELAGRLFPGANALGQRVYLDGGAAPATIVGIMERLQTPGTSEFSTSFAYSSLLVPSRMNSTFSRYAIRAKAGQLDAAMQAASSALYKANPQRVIADDGIQSYASVREQAYRADLGMAMLMGGISLILLGVTAAGVFGLTSFWVDQRERQIGIRRALGATRRNILGYFQLENLLIVGSGATTGIILAVGLNMLLMSRYEMPRLPVTDVMVGVVLVVLLSQVSTLIPARRAARVEPASAIRAT